MPTETICLASGLKLIFLEATRGFLRVGNVLNNMAVSENGAYGAWATPMDPNGYLNRENENKPLNLGEAILSDKAIQELTIKNKQNRDLTTSL